MNQQIIFLYFIILSSSFSFNKNIDSLALACSLPSILSSHKSQLLLSNDDQPQQIFNNELPIKTNIISSTMLTSSSLLSSTLTIDPDELYTFDELIASRGFQLLAYTVQTKDGYLLTLHRVVHPNEDDFSNKRPVILMHGLLGSSNNFFINSPFLKSEDNPGNKMSKLFQFLLFIIFLLNIRWLWR